MNVTAVLNPILSSISNYNIAKVQRNERYKLAVLAIATAADETRMYLRDSKEQRVRDNTKEAYLSKLWRQSAVELMEFDDNLAKRCEMKGEFWSDPASWSRKDIASARILLKDISEQVRQLIRPIK
jgi:hypothetical protein